MSWRRRAIALAVAIAAAAGLLGLRAALHETPWQRLHAEGGGRYTGSIYLPRAGRYVFGCQCARPVKLTVGDHALTLRQGPTASVGTSIDLDAGVAALTVEAPAGARLLWHPPGRRGDLE
ncbi:MAG: hypothetical protein KC464_06895, partial [Myxococcales bacterium]|nr:hypothetical protein [Myxococcales bacterium]